MGPVRPMVVAAMPGAMGRMVPVGMGWRSRVRPMPMPMRLSAVLLLVRQVGVVRLLVIVVLMVVTVLTSGYLVVVSAIKGFDEFRFKHWFSLSLWVTVPSLFSILAMILNFFFGPAGRTAPERLSPLSFNNLLAVPVSSPFSQVLNSLDLVTVWTWALLALGFRQWTGSSWLQSAIVVLAPVAVIYGSWGLIAWL